MAFHIWVVVQAPSGVMDGPIELVGQCWLFGEGEVQHGLWTRTGVEVVPGPGFAQEPEGLGALRVDAVDGKVVLPPKIEKGKWTYWLFLDRDPARELIDKNSAERRIKACR